MAEDEKETILKVIVLGSSQVGKTSILVRYFKNEFNLETLSTIGIDFKTKYFKFDEEKIKINFIDTAGQEKFRAISVNYLKGTDGVLLVFDITNKETFYLIQNWVEDIHQNNKSNIGKILLGNKSDLEESRQVSKEEAEQLAKDLGCPYIEASAKTGENINETISEIAKLSYEYYKKLDESEKRRSIKLTNNHKKGEQNKKGCC